MVRSAPTPWHRRCSYPTPVFHPRPPDLEALKMEPPVGRLRRDRARARSRARLSESIFEQIPEGFQSVAPADFLALVVAASVIGNPHFIDARAGPARDLRTDLHLDAEVVRAEPQRAGNLG